MATIQQQPTQYAAPHQSFEAVPLRELRHLPAPVDCPICGERVRTLTETKMTPMDCGDITKAICLGFLRVRTIRRKWIEHTCPNCKELLVRYHPNLQPSNHGVTRVEGGGSGETEVIAFARRPMMNTQPV